MITMQEIIQANKQAGKHFFDDDTLVFFDSKIGNRVFEGPNGVYFTTSEQRDDEPRKYTVREYDPVSDAVTTADGTRFQQFDTADKAERIARALAYGADVSDL